MQAIRATRPGGHVGYVGVSHGVELPGEELFFTHVHLHGGPAPVRQYLPELIELICDRTIDPGRTSPGIPLVATVTVEPQASGDDVGGDVTQQPVIGVRVGP